MAQAGTVNPNIITLKTGTDFSSSKYCCVSLASDNELDLAATDTINALGVLTDDVADGSSTSKGVSVAIGGVCKVTAGAAIVAGAAVMVTTGGKVITATTGKHLIGIVLETAAADGDIVSMVIRNSTLA